MLRIVPATLGPSFLNVGQDFAASRGKHPADGFQFRLVLFGICGIVHAESTQRVKNNLRDDQPGVFLFVGRDNIPRGVMRAGCANALLVSLRVVLPKRPLVNVCNT